jgi:hypothetical protein
VSNSESEIRGASLGLEWKSELSGQALIEVHGENRNALQVTELSENLRVVAELPNSKVTKLPDNTLP